MSTWENKGNSPLSVWSLRVGDGGTGQPAVSSGGLVTNDDGNIGNRAGSIGTVSVGAGTIRIWPDGTLHLDDGTIIADEIDHTHGGTFNFAAGHLTVGLFQGDLTNQGGTLAPGTDFDQLNNTAIPEPSSVVLLLLGLGCVMLRCCSRP